MTRRRKPLTIRGKLGTHASGLYEVRSLTDDLEPGGLLDEPPSVGDMVCVRSRTDVRVAKWTRVQVDLIKFGDFYYMQFM